MRFSTIAVAAFAGAAIAAPSREDGLVARGRLGVNQIVTRDAEAGRLGVNQIVARDDMLEKRMGPWAIAGLASLGTWAATKMGFIKRDGVPVPNKMTLPGTFSAEEAGALFADDAVAFLSKKKQANEAVVCADIPYTVTNDTNAHDIGAFTFEGNGIKSTYDCFVLAGPNTLTVDLTKGTATPDNVAVNPGPGSWNETTGILTI